MRIRYRLCCCDGLCLSVETKAEGEERTAVEKELKHIFKSKINVGIIPKAVGIGELPRSEKKTKRIIDNRNE